MTANTDHAAQGIDDAESAIYPQGANRSNADELAYIEAYDARLTELAAAEAAQGGPEPELYRTSYSNLLRHAQHSNGQSYREVLRKVVEIDARLAAEAAIAEARAYLDSQTDAATIRIGGYDLVVGLRALLSIIDSRA